MTSCAWQAAKKVPDRRAICLLVPKVVRYEFTRNAGVSFAFGRADRVTEKPRHCSKTKMDLP